MQFGGCGCGGLGRGLIGGSGGPFGGCSGCSGAERERGKPCWRVVLLD